MTDISEKSVKTEKSEKNDLSLSALPDTVAFDPNDGALTMIDQTLLPGELKTVRMYAKEDIFDAIRRLRVRGAPAIGVTAAFAMASGAIFTQRAQLRDRAVFDREMRALAKYYAASRPTAVNLFWALDRMTALLDSHPAADCAEMTRIFIDEAVRVRDEDVACCRAIGENALTLLKDGSGILTHCNAGQLATVRYGTALAPLHLGKERGMEFHVYADETRPLLQGARLTAYELAADGIDVTVCCDNMAASLMGQGKIDAVLVGSDRIAANGDVCNKIGTRGVAILAKYHSIPFYVLAPTSTIDSSCPSGKDIPIEQRAGDEVSEMWYRERMTPVKAGEYNPAFDVTEAELVTAIITEKGIFRH